MGDYPDTRTAVRSQLWMLGVMVVFTSLGLWILSAAGQKVPESKPVLEINTAHAIVKYLDTVTDEEQFKELAQLLYDQASLAEGGQLANPAEYVQRLNRLLVRLAGISHG